MSTSVIKWNQAMYKSSKDASDLIWNQNLSNSEASVYQNGAIVTGHIVFKISGTVPNLTGEMLASGLPKPSYTRQILGVCVAGTQNGKSARFAVNSNGNLITHYSSGSSDIFKQWDTWIIKLDYVAAELN